MMKIKINDVITDDLNELREKILDFLYYELELSDFELIEE